MLIAKPQTNWEVDLQERSLIGLEARAADGTEIGRISEVVADEESGESRTSSSRRRAGNDWRPR